MNSKRLALFALFITLTLYTGSGSLYLPTLSYAQNSALSQIDNADSEQGAKHSQPTKQDGQIVSGENSLLTGNNIQCQDIGVSVQHNSCNTEEISGPGVATVTITTILHADCSINCPVPDGQVQLVNNGLTRSYEANTQTTGGTTERTFLLGYGPYSIHAVGASESSHHVYNYGNMEGDCEGRDICFSSTPQWESTQHHVTVHFHYLTK